MAPNFIISEILYGIMINIDDLKTIHLGNWEFIAYCEFNTDKLRWNYNNVRDTPPTSYKTYISKA